MLDANLNEVPIRLEPVFVGRERLCQFIERLHLFRFELNKHEREVYFDKIDLPLAERCLTVLIHTLSEGSPHSPCLECYSSDANCPRCHGAQWLSVAEYEMRPKDGRPLFLGEASSRSVA